MWAWLVVVGLVSASGTWAARRYAIRRSLLDLPGERRSHSVATPRGGGVGPVLGFAFALAAAGAAGSIRGADWRWLLAAVVAVAAIGAWDDHRPLGAGIRLGIHALAGVCVAAGFGMWRGDVAGAIAVVGITAVLVNVWNFMDGIDGIASTQAIIVGAAAAVVTPDGWSWIAIAFCVAVAAFVPFNFPRARIFLGDVGSGALGAVIAILATAAATRAEGAGALLLLLPIAAFVTDAGLTLARRVLRGERWWSAHTQHAYQVAGRRHGHAAVTCAYALCSLLALVAVLALRGREATVIMLCAVMWYLACAGLWAGVQYCSSRWSEPAR